MCNAGLRAEDGAAGFEAVRQQQLGPRALDFKTVSAHRRDRKPTELCRQEKRE